MENLYPDLNTLCRLCLEPCNACELIEIFENNDVKPAELLTRVSTRIKIMSVVALEIQANDNLPKALCKDCRFTLEEAYVFRKKAQANDVKLRKHCRLLALGKKSRVFENEEDNEFEDELEFGDSLAFLIEERKQRDEKMRSRILSELKAENEAQLKKERRSLVEKLNRDKEALKNKMHNEILRELEPKLREQITLELRESASAECRKQEMSILLKDLEEFLMSRKTHGTELSDNSATNNNANKQPPKVTERLLHNTRMRRVDKETSGKGFEHPRELAVSSDNNATSDLVEIAQDLQSEINASYPIIYEDAGEPRDENEEMRNFSTSNTQNEAARVSVFKIKSDQSLENRSLKLRSPTTSYQIQDNGEIRLNEAAESDEIAIGGMPLDNVIEVLDCNQIDAHSDSMVYQEEDANIENAVEDGEDDDSLNAMELDEFIELKEKPPKYNPGSKKSAGKTIETATEGECPSLSASVPKTLKADSSGQRKTITPKIFKCPHCPTECSTQLVFKRHMKGHQKTSSFDCPECSITLSCKSALNRHMILHSDIKPFVCKECNKCFKQKEVLQRHKEIHKNLEDRRHKCMQCHTAFAQKLSLTQHITRYHTKNPKMPTHTCAICSKSFLYASGLSRHLASHSGIAYQCTDCLRNFGDRSSAKRHVLHLHNVSEGDSSSHIRGVYNGNKNDADT